MHVNIRCHRVGKSLLPADAGSAFAIENWKSDFINVELQDERRMHSRAQEKFWRGVCVPTVVAVWKEKRGWKIPDGRIANDACHDIWMRIVFGEIETPEGKARRSSTTLAVDEYTQLIDAVREYLLDFDVHLPQPHEVSTDAY